MILRSSRVSTLLATVIALAGFAADPARADLIEPVDQQRLVSGTAYADDLFGPASDFDEDSAEDFSPLDIGVAAQADAVGGGGIGSGGGSQNSSILPDRVIVTASMFATGEVWDFDTFAGGSSLNRCDVTFDLTAEADYALSGQLGQFDNGSTSLVLSGPGGTVHQITPGLNSLDPFSEQGTLDPGQYRLIAESSGSADGFEFFSEYASGEFDVSLIFSPATSVPDPIALLGGELTVTPNPFRTTARISLDLPRAGAASVAIVDVAGRLVRRFDLDASNAGSVIWDGRDAAGGVAPPGVYFAHASAGVDRAQKIIRLR